MGMELYISPLSLALLSSASMESLSQGVCRCVQWLLKVPFHVGIQFLQLPRAVHKHEFQLFSVGFPWLLALVCVLVLNQMLHKCFFFGLR